MAISSRQAGATVACPTCGASIQVPLEDQFTAESTANVQPDVQPPAEDPSTDSRNASESKNHEHAVEELDEIGDAAGSELNAEPANANDADVVADAAGEDEPFVPQEIGGDADDLSETPLTFRRHKNLDEEMDLTPMVDVTFQLLIFFMVSASFSLQKSIEVPTPDPDQKGASQQVQTLDDLQGTSIIVKIDASNTIFIDDDPLPDVNRLSDTLRDKMRREQKTELLVTADNQSLHRTVIAVIDAANEVGMQKIRMTSRTKTE